MSDEQPYRVENIIEGICPSCSTPLERTDDCGWCNDCGIGYSYQGGENPTTSLHIKLDVEGFKSAVRSVKWGRA